MTTYEISYSEFIDRNIPGHHGAIIAGQRLNVVVVGQQEAKNAVEAIRAFLLAKHSDDAELVEAIEKASSVGSNKRLVVCGITFQANKVTS